MNIAAAILERAHLAGDHPAIVCGEETLTYAELAAQAEAVAQRIAPGSEPIAVMAYRRPQTIVEILGILLAGRAYLPLNPADPDRRRESILEAARVPVAADLAYVFFTSGSTGMPKGVPLTHGNASAFVNWAADTFDLRPSDRVGVYAPLFFDLSTFDVYVGLRSGATLLLVPDDVAKFSRASAEYLRDATVLYAVPSALLGLLAEGAVFPHLRLLLLAGEAFPAGHLSALRAAAPQAALHNLYGPIESNVVSHFAVPTDWPDGADVPIGKPVSGAELRLHDGELVISGPSVFGGYLGVDLDPFVELDGRRWYRTGDLAELGPHGDYLFHGRRDQRIKSRGFLVEPAEIERALCSHPQVTSAAVVATDGVIQAFVVSEVDSPELKRWCGRLLPRYMWPEQVHHLEQMPLGRTGKVDRQSLSVLSTVLHCVHEIAVDEVDVGPDTPLLELSTMDSIALFDLLTAVEKATGRTLPPERVVPGTFATARLLAQALEES